VAQAASEKILEFRDVKTGVNGAEARLLEPAANTSLYFDNFPAGITEDRIREVLGKVGGVLGVALLPGVCTSAATVTFDEIKDAQWCRKYMDGKIPSGSSSAICVRYAHPAWEARALRYVGWEKLRVRREEEAAARVNDSDDAEEPASRVGHDKPDKVAYPWSSSSSSSTVKGGPGYSSSRHAREFSKSAKKEGGGVGPDGTAEAGGATAPRGGGKASTGIKDEVGQGLPPARPG
jgi:RNA recognition motif-containing protein